MAHEGMVHALEESRRILAREGLFIDIRPVTSYPPIEVITGDGAKLAGRADDALGLPDDQAAFEAIAESLRRGVFFKEADERFEFYYYWDTVEEMQAFVEERWEGWITIQSPTFQNVTRIIRAYPEMVKLRMSLSMLISRYSWRE